MRNTVLQDIDDDEKVSLFQVFYKYYLISS